MSAMVTGAALVFAVLWLVIGFQLFTQQPKGHDWKKHHWAWGDPKDRT
jgi:hypothetical protein